MPPLAVRAAVYALPTVPPGSELVVIAIGAGAGAAATVTVLEAHLVLSAILVALTV